MASDGGIFAVGHAGVFTSTGSLALNNRVVGMPPSAQRCK